MVLDDEIRTLRGKVRRKWFGIKSRQRRLMFKLRRLGRRRRTFL